jgi:parallel beta-helix repeat protein
MNRTNRLLLVSLTVSVSAATVGCAGVQAQRARRQRTTTTTVATVPATTPATTTAPETLPPATQPPVTQPAVTQPAVTQPPATQPPATQPTAAPPGDTFFLSPNGDNSYPGTQALPWRTLPFAASKLTAGQTLLVTDGTYTDGLYTETSGAPGRPITFKAAPGASPKIVLTNPDYGGVLIKGASYVRVEGLDFSYVGPSGPFPKDTGLGDGFDITVSDSKKISHHIEVIGNKIHNFPGAGFGGLQADYLLIEGNMIWGNSFWSDYDTSGISLYQTVDFDRAPGFHNIIRANTVFGNANKVADRFSGVKSDGNCIIIDDQRRYQTKLTNRTNDGPYQSSTLVENNICAGNGGRGVHVFNSDNVMVRNNTMYQNLQTPEMTGGEMTAAYFVEPADIGKNIPASRGNVRFVNNIVVSDAKQATSVYASTPADENNATFDHNFYFGTSPVSKLGDTDITGNAMPFVSPSVDIFTANFRLLPTAWAIDRALPEQSPSIDVGGIRRPQGGAPDMGAWEFIFR